MITLTDEQKQDLMEHREKWKQIILNCEPLDMGGAIEAANLSYRLAGKKEPRFFFAFDSPLSGGIACFLLVEIVKTHWKGVRGIQHNGSKWQDWYSDKPLTRSIEKMSVQDRVHLIANEVVRQCNGQFKKPVKASVLDKFYKMTDKQLRQEFNNQLYGMICGSHDGSWLAFYEYFLEKMNEKKCESSRGLFKMARCCGWWSPYVAFAVFQHRHESISITPDEQISNMNGPAVKYRDGYGLYIMNGITVPAHIANTPANELDPHLILTEKNAEIRREIHRKIGSERMCKALNARVIEEQVYEIDVPIGLEEIKHQSGWLSSKKELSEKDRAAYLLKHYEVRREPLKYRLLELDLGDGRRRPYLEMTNPSLGVTVTEGVPPDTRTVMEAINFRNGGRGLPAVLS